MSITHLVTHNGGFHADELLSSVVLTRLFPMAELIRTRSAQWIEPGCGRIIYDVGRDYDAERGIFDHHQKDAPLRDDGQPFSSFGLVWRHYGRDYLRLSGIPEGDIADIHASFDRDFVLPIDLLDNGALSPSVAGPLSGLTLPMLLESLKPVFDDPAQDADDRAFNWALVIARAFVEASIARKASRRRAAGIVRDAIVQAGEGRVLELPQGMPYRKAVIASGADHLLFVVHPRDGGDWALNGIRLEDDGFALRADLPTSWAGLTDHALEEAAGVSGAKFCHNARFIAVADSRDAIMEMARIAVAEAE
ncbi:MYG1 family protein [Paracoccus sp. 1_MG-2023]|uniref:MYG1 family protein n=1 Tax=unclassified Paracoccus (in: a-proteobacteria) TaxID=2688777 RepID=UPI001C09C7DC|nr:MULTISPECIES: MYG1 family protein [unclassified Paracoccus (in: a-proteobacteria)]MBU2958904.1 MYG1 family protein [Paracoccus sp. C2R09]MDO6670422.1 MYG1 family protein [Paracoccus sp. 1_MG-2023]